MFTGLIQSIGVVTGYKSRVLELQVAIKSPVMGESIAVNGVCLTVIKKKKKGQKWLLSFDLSPETLKLTNLSSLRMGSPVNIERCVTLQTFLGGHLVQGHVDAISQVRFIKKLGSNKEIGFTLPKSVARYVVYKGSVAVNGVSLTAAKVKGNMFSVALVPHTLRHTNLRNLKQGDFVNLEVDVIAKYVEKMISRS